MTDCPNCGMGNAATRAFCAVCGTKLEVVLEAEVSPALLPQGSPPIHENNNEGLANLDWLLSSPPAQPSEDLAVNGSTEAPSLFDDSPNENNGVSPNEALDLAWLLDEEPTMPSEEHVNGSAPTAPPIEAAPEPPPRTVPPATNASHLPAWLQGADMVQAEPLEKDEPEWDDDLDFSDLPDWPLENMDGSATSAKESQAPEVTPAEDPFALSKEKGSGLLAGIDGPIPIGRIIAAPHHAPTFPGQAETLTHSEDANLFAQIAGGAVMAEPLAPPIPAPRGASLFHLLLVAVIVLPLLASIGMVAPPPAFPATNAFISTVESLPEEGKVLIAFDYQGEMRDELEPAAVATLNHLHQVAAKAKLKNVNVMTVSTVPEGSALAEHAWVLSQAYQEDSQNKSSLNWQDVGYRPGGLVGLRALLQETFTTEQSQEELLVIIITSESQQVHHWIEQVSASLGNVPMLAIAPTIAETTLMPYFASGQLDGLLAGLPSTASYEHYGALDSQMASRRMTSTTAGALLVVLVIIVGNVAAFIQRRRLHQETNSHEQPS